MQYRPIVTRKSGSIRATALVGVHSVILGFDHLGPPAGRADFLGFAIHRTDRTAEEAWWLNGQIRFRDDPGDFGDDVPSHRAPFQKFHWGDYTAKPGHEYAYRIHPLVRTPQGRKLGLPVTLDLRTGTNSAGVPGVYFNRGVTAALAYRKRFGDRPPAEVPDGAAYRWLSRGLEEALLEFVRDTMAGDTLKVAIYEFEHPDIIEELKRAAARGVIVRLVYHARAGDGQTALNAAHVGELGLPPDQVTPRTRVPAISHNKLMVRVRGGAPDRVWTGSTNFTESGLFTQTNVGLLFREKAVAHAYDAYFDLLRQDPDTDTMKDRIPPIAAAGSGRTAASSRRIHFSPVRGVELLNVAADIVRQAEDALFISSPFGLDRRIVDALNANRPDVLEYGLVNTSSAKRLLGALNRNVVTWWAAPASLGQFAGTAWDARAFGHHKIHVKSIVADPWGDRPRVLIGSANFSDESVGRNDENAVLIEGDERIAAIVATEFIRMFDHYKFRDYVAGVRAGTKPRYLGEDGAWTARYYDPARREHRDRIVFAGG